MDAVQPTDRPMVYSIVTGLSLMSVGLTQKPSLLGPLRLLE
jgi:hypothetical protein